MPLSAEARARNIKVLIFDVDGVLTDGQIIVAPIPASRTPADPIGSGIEIKGFSAHDGLGISLARLGGLRVGLITKRQSQTVAIRARDLKLEWVYQGQAHKLAAAQEIASKAGISMEQMAYVGDDIVDFPVMRICGLAIATANARPQVQGHGPLHHPQPRRPRRRARRHRLHPHRPGHPRSGHRAVPRYRKHRRRLRRCRLRQHVATLHF